MSSVLGRLSQLASWCARYEKWLLIALLAYWLRHVLLIARKEFWFDEIMTFYIAQLPSVGRIVDAGPSDGQPPLYYLLAHFSQSLFGPTELATRLPSIAAFLAALATAYFFVKRHGSAIGALFACFCLGTAGMTYYATEARPYALMLAFTGLALVSWQVAVDSPTRRLLPLMGLALSVAGAIASHHFGIIHVAVPIAAGEAYRLGVRRRADLPVYAAGLAGSAMLLLTVPMMQRTQRVLFADIVGSSAFTYKPSLKDIASYADMVDPPLVALFFALLIVLGLVWYLSSQRRPPTARQPIPGHEWAAAIALTALVPLIIVVTWLAVGQYLPRYAIGASLGVAILLGFAISAADRTAPVGTLVALICIALPSSALIGQRALSAVRPTAGQNAPSTVPAPPASVLGAAPPDLPIAVASPVDFPALWRNSSPELRGRLHYLADPSFASGTENPLPELSLVRGRAFLPFKVDEYASFVAAHPEFLVYWSRYTEQRGLWLYARLLAEGYTFEAVAKTNSSHLLMARKN